MSCKHARPTSRILPLQALRGCCQTRAQARLPHLIGEISSHATCPKGAPVQASLRSGSVGTAIQMKVGQSSQPSCSQAVSCQTRASSHSARGPAKCCPGPCHLAIFCSCSQVGLLTVCWLTTQQSCKQSKQRLTGGHTRRVIKCVGPSPAQLQPCASSSVSHT